ncbi:MAG TPA: hypothetical protein PKY81_02555 [bacterium]|nr:hypothetical protein [bacterium]HPN29817.1 hypothetical protein [bacterium]
MNLVNALLNAVDSDNTAVNPVFNVNPNINCGSDSISASANTSCSNENIIEKTDSEKKELVLKNDVKMPPRTKIREALKKVSNFSEAEISILYWSSLYKAYSLIVRYEQKGVEDEFRSYDWFQNAMKSFASPADMKSESNSTYDFKQYPKKSYKQNLTKDQLSEIKEQIKIQKKIAKEKNKGDKKSYLEIKKCFKEIKKQIKIGGVTFQIFCDFMTDISVGNFEAVERAIVKN